MNKPTVFISYSHKDESWEDRLRPHLKMLEQAGQIILWDDRKIDAGATWYNEIEKNSAQAAVSVCLISADYLASDFINKEEIPYLLQRRERDGMLLLPILVKPCLWEAVPWLSAAQMLPRDGKSVSEDFQGKEDGIFREVAATIHKKINDPNYRPPAPPPAKWNHPEKIDITRLPLTGAELFGRDTDLKQLDEIWESQNVNVISLVAWGGVGKSTLINKWLERLAVDNYRGARRVYGWSFHSQGTNERVTSADQFIAAALQWFGDPDPQYGSPWDKGERLAQFVRQQKTLLMLDGLEPLQSGLEFERGKIKDPALAVLLTALARDNNGLCLITTRETVADLQEIGSTVQQRNLEEISPQAGRALLHVGGVKGTDAELEKATADFGHHALAINLLAAFLHDIPGQHISHSSQISDLNIPEEKGKHPRRVMAAFEKRFGESPELQVLQILGLFDRPADLAAVATVRATPGIAGLTDKLQNLSEAQWLETLENLRQYKLLAPQSWHDPDTLDCHPLVREYFGEKLKKKNRAAWKKAHNRLYKYYKSVAKKYPDTIEEMTPLYIAVAHGCQAGHRQEALDDVYYDRIQRDYDSYNTSKLGAFGAELTVLSNFFDQPWLRPATELTEDDKGYVLFEVGYNFHVLGRLMEAVSIIQKSLKVANAQKDWMNAANRASSLSTIYLHRGDLSKSLEYARRSVKLADKSGDAFERLSDQTILAEVLYQKGRLRDAEETFSKAENILKNLDPKHPYLFSPWGFQYCELLLSKGEYQEVENRVKKFFKWRQREDSLYEIALDHLILGRTYLLQVLNHKRDDSTGATKNLEQALAILKQSRRQVELSYGLLVRAESCRVLKKFEQAQHDLNEVITIATRGGMRLHEADCHLEYARLHLAMGEKDKARESLAKAEKMIAEMGYHRRDPEIHLIQAQLALASRETDTARESLAKAKELIEKMGMHRWNIEVKSIEEQLAKSI